MPVQYNRLGKNLQAIRKRRNITQKGLAEMLGCSTEHLCHIESGKRHIQLDMLNLFCEVLGVSYEEVLSGATQARINNAEASNVQDQDALEQFAQIISGCSDAKIHGLLDICWQVIELPR